MVTTAMFRSLSIYCFGFARLCGVLFRTLATKTLANTPLSRGPRQPRTVSSLTQEATTSPRVVNPCGTLPGIKHRLLWASLVLHTR